MGVFHNLELVSEEVDYFLFFIDEKFCELVSQEANKYVGYCQEWKLYSKWEDEKQTPNGKSRSQKKLKPTLKCYGNCGSLQNKRLLS